MAFVQVVGLTWSGGGRFRLNIERFEMQPNEKVAIVGPNGAGKSTFLLLLVGLLRGSGRVVLLDEDVSRGLSDGLKSRVGLVFQSPDDQLFLPTVFEEIAFQPRQMGLGEEEVAHLVEKAVLAVGLDATYYDVEPHQMSMGEKRKVTLALATVMNPVLLLCDEPTANLDPASRREIVALLRDFGGALLVTTHDIAMAYEVAQRVVVLSHGSIVADGPADRILFDEALMQAHRLESITAATWTRGGRVSAGMSARAVETPLGGDETHDP